MIKILLIALGIISKDTILKAIHNLCIATSENNTLGIISKDTILKAIHNPFFC